MPVQAATPKPASALLAPLGLTITALFWGAMIPISHALVSQVYAPLFLATLRYIAPTPVLLLMCLLLDRRWPFRRDLPLRPLFLLGLAMAGFSLCFAFGVLQSDPVRAAIVMSSAPLLATLLARIMYRMPLERGFKLALIAAIVGGAMVALDAIKPRSGAPEPPIPYLGELLLVLANVIWTWYSMKAQEWLVPRGLSQMQISFLTTFAGLLVMAVVIGCAESLAPGQVPTSWPDGRTMMMILWMGVGAAGIAVVLWNFGVSHVGVPVASIFGNLAPVFSVLIAYSFFGASLSVQQLAGGAIILAGILRMQWLRLRR